MTDEHFVVWMRTAALPTFRNLYGRIEHDLVAPAEVRFNVTASECDWAAAVSIVRAGTAMARINCVMK